MWNGITKTLSLECTQKLIPKTYTNKPRLPFCKRLFATYEGRAIADEELIKESDDWAVEETNFCLGRFPAHTYFPETADMARRTLQLMETQKSRMFTRLRDGTVIPVMGQMIHAVYDNPDTLFNYFERPVVKYTWDETYDDAWEDEEEGPEYDEGVLPEAPIETMDPAMAELELIRRTTGGI